MNFFSLFSCRNPELFCYLSLGDIRLGGTDVESLNKGIDSILLKYSKILVTNYEKKLGSLTTDDASVNKGRISGLMTRFGLERNC